MELEVQDAGEAAEILGRQPVLAILTIDDDIQLFRGNRSNFADLIRTGREHGFLVYVVTVKQLKLTQRQLNGFTYNDKTDTWLGHTFPFPDLVYNRIPLREDELQPTVRRKLEALLNHPRIHLFNPHFFNKWTLFKWLREAPTTRPYIPTTRRMNSREALSEMMREHPYLYLKPVSGKAGKGIMTIKVRPEKTLPFRLQIQAKRKSIAYNCGTIGKLWTRVRKESGGERYIAQQGIPLASFQTRRFDLRVLAQKNIRGQWEVTGIGARVAGALSITTHVPRGGSIEDPEKLLVSVFGQDEARKIYIRAKQAALIIAKQIERGAGMNHAEMSMDLGIDQMGNVWFFEANAKPMKFDEPEIRKQSLDRIFQYSRYLLRAGGKR